MSLMPEGPHWYPADTVRDTPEPMWVAELVREQLLHVLHEELPHSVATRVVEWEWPRVRVEILVETELAEGHRDRQGGTGPQRRRDRVRKQLPAGAFIELVVAVEPNWQQDRSAIERLGY